MTVPSVARRLPTPEFDPTLPLAEAARYLGCCVKTLNKFQLERTPIPGTGRKRPKFGIRLSVLNAFRDRLANPQARTPLLRRSA